MRIAVEGCAHGELEVIYDTIAEAERVSGKKIDLLICCGDFQATRNLSDLKCMAVPNKFKSMCTFYKYYSGEKVAPILTIFIGGNHEASNYLQELPYGGWVAPNIYYMGYASVVNVGGIRIAGISGIYKGQDWLKGHFEKPPYNDHSIRSVYHVRNLEIFRLKQLTGNIDIFLSHDWPQGIVKYGNVNALLRIKPAFREDIENNTLGSPASMDLLEQHHPKYWFAAHMHCKFAAVVPDENNSRLTKFLALDKCLPKRKFLQVIDIDHNTNGPIQLSYDLEWLTVLYLTNHLLSVKSGFHYMPSTQGNNRTIFTPTDEEKENTLRKFEQNLKIPENFVRTAEPYDPTKSVNGIIKLPTLTINNQTTEFCNKLGIDDPFALLELFEPVNKSDISSERSSPIIESSFEQSCASESTSDYIESDGISVVIDRSGSFDLKNSLSPLTLPAANIKLYDNEDIKEKETMIQQHSLSPKRSTSEEDESPVVRVEPNSKKFKRRNQSIYSNNN